MNIVVLTSGGRIIVRPDTSWERDNEDLFLPEFVDNVSWSPVLFAKICKPGRSIGEKFAERYYDGVGYGVLLYPEDFINGDEEGYACASCLDHSSYLPASKVDSNSILSSDFSFRLRKDEKDLFSYTGADTAMLAKALAKATRYCYIRVGDLLAIELQPRLPLCSRKDTQCNIDGDYGSILKAIDFKIIF